MKVLLGVVLAGVALIGLGVVATRTQAPVASATPRPTFRTAAATAAPTPPPSPTRGAPLLYVSSTAGSPLAVLDPKGIEGDTVSSRVYYRLLHLWSFTGPVPPGYAPIAPNAKGKPYRVGVTDDLAVVSFVVPPEGWGIDAGQVKMLLLQIVFTATEEPGIERVRLRQEGTPTFSDPEDGPPLVISGTRVPIILTRENVVR